MTSRQTEVKTVVQMLIETFSFWELVLICAADPMSQNKLPCINLNLRKLQCSRTKELCQKHCEYVSRFSGHS